MKDEADKVKRNEKVTVGERKRKFERVRGRGRQKKIEGEKGGRNRGMGNSGDWRLAGSGEIRLGIGHV